MTDASALGAAMTTKDKITICGPREDGSSMVEFRLDVRFHETGRLCGILHDGDAL